ncbi:MAG: ATP-dependent sacrificial sulfur transferase LarE [Archaeoglobaceae archaeon]
MICVELDRKLENLRKFLSSFKNAVVAFSGGVDSATLSAICKEVIGDVLAVTVRSAKSPSREIENAKRVAEEIGVEHEFIEADIFFKEFVENSELRCYYCKKFLLKVISEFAIERGYEVIFEGTNASDLQGHRPGYKAIIECEIVFAPWADFGITKDEIREIAKSIGFSFYKAPPLACLASRIPYGVKITPEILKMVDKAENFVIEIAKVENVRVRYLNGFAVVEVDKGEIPRILERGREIKEALVGIGFESVFINPNGYRTGVFVKKLEDLVEI